jgi:hypothetical protein
MLVLQCQLQDSLRVDLPGDGKNRREGEEDRHNDTVQQSHIVAHGSEDGPEAERSTKVANLTPTLDAELDD